jgi:hypothetical protein
VVVLLRQSKNDVQFDRFTMKHKINRLTKYKIAMKKTVIILSVLALIMVDCKPKSSPASPQTPPQTDTLNIEQELIQEEVNKDLQNDFCSQFTNNKNVWDTDYNKAGDLCLIRGNGLDSIKNSIEKLVLAWNKNYTVKIKLIQTEKDVISINIPNATYLTQQAGTSGASRILAAVVYTLTEHSKYHLVNIDFIESEHAAPATYSRKDFEEEFIICGK